jgi:hypothetical protein
LKISINTVNTPQSLFGWGVIYIEPKKWGMMTLTPSPKKMEGEITLTRYIYLIGKSGEQLELGQSKKVQQQLNS